LTLLSHSRFKICTIDDFHEESEELIDDLHDHFTQNQVPTLLEIFNAYKLEESFIKDIQARVIVT